MVAGYFKGTNNVLKHMSHGSISQKVYAEGAQSVTSDLYRGQQTKWKKTKMSLYWSCKVHNNDIHDSMNNYYGEQNKH